MSIRRNVRCSRKGCDSTEFIVRELVYSVIDTKESTKRQTDTVIGWKGDPLGIRCLKCGRRPYQYKIHRIHNVYYDLLNRIEREKDG